VAPELTPALAPTSALMAVGDPSRTRTVYLAIALLVALGAALVVLTVWLVRRTRVDPDVLAPLELMGDRSWRRASDVDTRVQRLDEVRPDGALTLAAIAPMLASDPGDEDAAHVAVDPGDGEVVDGPVQGPPAPPHVVTPEEIDEILRRLAGPPAADDGGQVDGTSDAVGDGAGDSVEPELVTVGDASADVVADEHDGNDGPHAEVRDQDAAGDDVPDAAEPGGAAEAPDGQPTHG
jgi:hypothetical protein